MELDHLWGPHKETFLGSMISIFRDEQFRARRSREFFGGGELGRLFMDGPGAFAAVPLLAVAGDNREAFTPGFLQNSFHCFGFQPDADLGEIVEGTIVAAGIEVKQHEVGVTMLVSRSMASIAAGQRTVLPHVTLPGHRIDDFAAAHRV